MLYNYIKNVVTIIIVRGVWYMDQVNKLLDIAIEETKIQKGAKYF